MFEPKMESNLDQKKAILIENFSLNHNIFVQHLSYATPLLLLELVFLIGISQLLNEWRDHWKSWK